MNPPDYFIADLPREATLTEVMVREACQSLKHNQETYLAGQSTGAMIDLVSDLARQWCDPEFPLRVQALKASPAETGFSPRILEKGMDAFFGSITPANLDALVCQDLGHSERLDRFVSSEAESLQARASLATGPELILHITAGNVPCPAWMSMILGCVLRSAQFVKAPSESDLLIRLFGHSLYQASPKTAASLEIARWEGGKRPDLDKVFAEEVTCVTATGSDQALDAVRRDLGPSVPVHGYGQRVSLAIVARESLTRMTMPKWIEALAEDVVMWDQRGCLSPHVLYVENQGTLTPQQVAEALAQALERREGAEPRAPLPVQDGADIHARRNFYQLRQDLGPETRLWSSKDSTAWTVVYERDSLFQLSCQNRFVYVKPFADLEEILHQCDRIRNVVSTVGLQAPVSRQDDWARQLSRWGVSRICPIGQMQYPSPAWRHDGRPSLADLVRWTDLEGTADER